MEESDCPFLLKWGSSVRHLREYGFVDFIRKTSQKKPLF